MSFLLIVERPSDCPLHVPGVELVPARKYLTDPEFSGRRGVVAFNLCRSYRYKSLGYYVSLLAAARGHKPLPNVMTIQDLKNRSLVRLISEDIHASIRRSFANLISDEFVLSIYFGRSLAKRYERLSRELFDLFPAPLLRGRFTRHDGDWRLQSLQAIAAKDIPESHADFVVEAAREYFLRRRTRRSRKNSSRYDMAVLVNPQEKEPPSDERALRRFAKAGQALGFRVEFLEPTDFGHLAEFDALFLRETTAVDDHTYRFARRTAADGLVVIDDPDSILRCTNKVYLAELLQRAGVRTPRTIVIHRDNVTEAGRELQFPCILKVPDGSFSKGVVRADDAESFREQARAFLEDSELVIAQEFLASDFDWRVGVLDRRPLYVSKYFMATGHWQIINWSGRSRNRYGKVETMDVADAPPSVVKTAVKAANLIGDGLYGVDLKAHRNKSYVIEVNDNPNIEAGCEDAAIGERLYETIMEVFLSRVEAKKRGGRSP